MSSRRPMCFSRRYNIFSDKSRKEFLTDTERFDLGGEGLCFCGDCLLCFCNSLGLADGLVVKVLGFDFPLGLQGLDDILVLPAHIVAQPSQGTELQKKGYEFLKLSSIFFLKASAYIDSGVAPHAGGVEETLIYDAFATRQLLHFHECASYRKEISVKEKTRGNRRKTGETGRKRY